MNEERVEIYIMAYVKDMIYTLIYFSIIEALWRKSY